ncbi:MAG: polyhydroxyalkanoate depolymerase [Rhodospirillales bacterium CG15_BIG_FIL_POST_REV_8_21_14_020_66_15]|nr:MAG: polyhydroxyalkanoate depolymerase [Rhodospirillales bacterium CG15_BIG_FIL_POST_REV_8_21_14_020_66_15]
MLYYLHEVQRLAMAPSRAVADALTFAANNPMNAFSHTPVGKAMGSAAEIYSRMTHRYGKPDWSIENTVIDGKTVAVEAETMIHRTYCDLVHFKRRTARQDPKVLIVAPLSGHFATLLRGTVEAMLPDHDVYITDWIDCRNIPVMSDLFNLNDYIDYVIDFLHFLGPHSHVIAVCQPSVPVMAAVSVMSGWGDICRPDTMTLMGGPVDTRVGQTAVNKLAKDNDRKWFEKHVITTVPLPYPGAFRRVLPGFVQLSNFISMNLERHLMSMNELFDHLVEGDGEAADRKRVFYEEYLAVMDLPAEYFLQTLEVVFQEHALPRGEMTFRWQQVDPGKIKDTAVLCVEGELDDISGVGQTRAALDITPNLPRSMKKYHLEKGVGHYGVFNGRKWRENIAPTVKAFMREHSKAPAKA